jgi:hypothetical protein
VFVLASYGTFAFTCPSLEYSSGNTWSPIVTTVSAKSVGNGPLGAELVPSDIPFPNIEINPPGANGTCGTGLAALTTPLSDTTGAGSWPPSPPVT